MIDCHDGKIVAYTDGYGPNAQPADTMPEKAAATLPEGARPRVRSDRGRHHRRPGWLELMERVRADEIDGREGPFSGQRGRRGFLRRDEGRVRPPRAVGGSHPWGDARVDRRVHPPVRPRSHQAIAWLDEPGAIPAESWIGCVIISKKMSATPYHIINHEADSSDGCNTFVVNRPSAYPLIPTGLSR